METERDKWNLEKSVRENRLVSETTAHRVYTQLVFFPRGESSSYVGFCKEAKRYGGRRISLMSTDIKYLSSVKCCRTRRACHQRNCSSHFG